MNWVTVSIWIAGFVLGGVWVYTAAAAWRWASLRSRTCRRVMATLCGLVTVVMMVSPGFWIAVLVMGMRKVGGSTALSLSAFNALLDGRRVT